MRIIIEEHKYAAADVKDILKAIFPRVSQVNKKQAKCQMYPSLYLVP